MAEIATAQQETLAETPAETLAETLALAVCCECGSVPDFTKRWLKLKAIQYPESPCLHGTKLKAFVRDIPASSLKSRLEEILNRRGRFSFFFVYDSGAFSILEEVDVLHGGERTR